MAEIAEAKVTVLNELGLEEFQETRRDEILDALTDQSYDMSLLTKTFKLQEMGDRPLATHLKNFFHQFFTNMLETSVDASFMCACLEDFDLAACADKWTARACKR
jgi:hypothetical protein